MALTTAQGSAAYLNRAYNDANATPTVFATNVADLTANEMAAADKFDDATLTDAALAKKVLINMGMPGTANADFAKLETELAAYFGGMGKGHRGFVVLQLSRVLADKTDALYGPVATSWNTEVAASLADSTNQTLALTTSTTDVLAGGQGADIFTGVLSLLNTSTLQATDTITGGVGNDQLNISLSTSFSGFTTGSVSGVETIAITNAGATGYTFASDKITGATTYTIDSTTGPITALSNLQAGVATINVTNQVKDDLTTSFASGVTAPTVVAANLTSFGSTTSKTLTLGGYSTANITATGTNKFTLGGSAIDTITLAGSGTVTIAGVPATTTSFDASTATGGVSVNTTAVNTDQSLTSVKTGSGVDTITATKQDLALNATISGGAGSGDSLVYSSTGGTVEYKMTGVETLTVGALTTAATVFSGRNTTDLTSISTDDTTAQALTLVNMGSGSLTFTSKNATVSAGAVSSDHTGATTVTYSALAADVTAKTSTAKAAGYTFGSAAGALTVNVGDYVNTNGSDITATKASSVTLNVNSAKSSDSTPVEKTIFNSIIAAPLATSVTVTATGQLGDATSTSASAAKITADVATTATITTNGTNTGYMYLVAPKLTSLTTSAAKSLTVAEVTSGTDLAGVLTVNATATTGTTTLPSFSKASSATFGGTGTTSAVTVGALGSTSADYGSLTVNSSGLKGGLTVGAMNTATGNDITINANDSTGALTFGYTSGSAAVNTSGDDFYVNAERSAGAVKVGNMVAATTGGDIVVKVGGASGAVNVGYMYGDNVTLDMASNIAGGTIGAIKAKTSATVSLSNLQDNNTASTALAITANTGSTSLAVNVTGGIGIDQVTVTGIATNTSITVTGDLGTGTDSLTVNGLASTGAATFDISGVTSYNVGTITGGRGADTIKGGAGADRISGYMGADSLTGNGGNDTFVFSNGDSSAAAYDTINDFNSGDIIEYGGAATSLFTTLTPGTTTSATISTLGVATFEVATTSTTLANRIDLINTAIGNSAGKAVFFLYGTDTFMYIDAGASTTTNDNIVIKLTGVAIPTTAITQTGSTGLNGFGY